MKPYGMKRVPELQQPDKGDISGMALKSSTGSFPAKSGDQKNSCRSVVTKAATRRIQKRRARITGKAACQEN